MTGTPYADAGACGGARGLDHPRRARSTGLGARIEAARRCESAIGRLVPSTVNVQKVSLGEGTITIEGVTQR